MKFYLYQVYFSQEQISQLDVGTIPYDNLENRTPNLREYPMWKNLYWKHQHEKSDVIWGLISTKWRAKTNNLDPMIFKKWVNDNPGYDLYHIDPFNFNSSMFPNTWVQGDRWHPGMIDAVESLYPGISKTVLAPDEFITANYYFGNSIFWHYWTNCLDEALAIANRDREVFNWLYSKGGMYNGHWVPNFPFFTERLVTSFVHESRKILNLKILRYPT